MSYIEENGYFIFDGIKSSDYGVWINGGGTYNAPKRRYKDYTVPGRNGTLTIDEGVFEEIEVVYPAFIARDFPANIEAFRNQLMSRSGYVRMTDSYHPDEYYLAKYMDGLESDVLPAGVGGQFNLKFKRDPRRFLVSGETPRAVGEWGETETASGEIVTLDLVEGQAFRNIIANIAPTQSGSGDPSPSNVRPISGWTGCNVYVSPTTTAGDGTTYHITFPSSAGTVYGGTVDVVSGTLIVTDAYKTLDGTESGWGLSTSTTYIQPFITVTDMTNTFTGICDTFKRISYSEMNTKTGIVPYADSRIRFSLLHADAEEMGVSNLPTWKTWLGAHPVSVVYPLATPLTYQLTPQEVAILVGINNIWANTGDVTVKYGDSPNRITNPTHFASRPQVKITPAASGTKTVTIGDQTITINSVGDYVIVDSEIQSCYRGVNNLNSQVSFNLNDFPVLEPGANNIAYDDGIESVEITPNWYRV